MKVLPPIEKETQKKMTKVIDKYLFDMFLNIRMDHDT